MNRILLTLLFILTSAVLQAQPSPEQLLDAASSDTARLTVLRQLAIKFRSENIERSLLYAREGVALARKLSEKSRQASFYVVMGNSYAQVADHAGARSYLDSAYSLFEALGDHKGMASTLSGIGAVYQRQSDLVNAVKYFLRAYKMAEAAGDPRAMFLSTYNIAIAYCDQRDGTKAVEYARKALKMAKEHKEEQHRLGMCLATLAEAHRINGDTLEAQRYFAAALQEYERKGDEYGIAATYTNWALVVNDVHKEIEYERKAQDYWDRSETEDLMVVANLGNLGARYYELYLNDITGGRYGDKAGLLQKASSCLERSIAMARRLGSYGYEPEPLKTWAAIQYLRGNYKDAYENLERATRIADTVFSQENKNLIARLESQQKIALRDKEIRIGKVELHAQKRQTLALVVLAILLLIIGLLFYRQSRLRKKANIHLLRLNAELDEANKLKARLFGVLSHDLRSPVARLVSYLRLQKELPALMDKETAAVYADKIKSSAEHLLDTMENILLWSKSQMQQFIPHKEAVAVDSLFEDMARQFDDAAVLHFRNPEGITLHTDPEFLKTILRNLTDNALKAVKEQPGKRVTWSAGLKNGRNYLSVEDNGPGAEAERFRALSDPQAPVVARNGLGFHLVRDMAAAIDCRIVLQSEPGKGTVIFLFF